MGKSRRNGSLGEAELEEAAIRYLERYSSSVTGLRRVLRRRVRRAAGAGDATEGTGAAIEAVLAKLIRIGLLDDARYAEARAASLARRGRSLSVIRRDLAVRGVPRALVDAALGMVQQETGGSADEMDRLAALALARRRRLGPYRASGARVAFRDRDLAAMGRAGFALEIAKSVIDGEAENG